MKPNGVVIYVGEFKHGLCHGQVSGFLGFLCDAVFPADQCGAGADEQAGRIMLVSRRVREWQEKKGRR